MFERASELKPIPVLTECCARSVECRLHVLRSGSVSQANFYAIRAGRVQVRLESCQRDESLQPDSLCCMAFHFHHYLCGFMASIKQVRELDGSLEVQLELPSELAAKNMRQAFRVPVVRESGVELMIHLADGTQLGGEAVNISESGIEVKLLVDEGLMSVDDEVTFELRFRDDRLTLPATVRRREHSRRGFQFLQSSTLESRATATSLQRVVRSLEQLWLKSRLV